jgi:hypothetical protein
VLNNTYFWGKFIGKIVWKSSAVNEEKERIKQLIKPVYEWFRTMK